MNKPTEPASTPLLHEFARRAAHGIAALSACFALASCATQPIGTAHEDEDFIHWQQIAQEAAFTQPPAPRHPPLPVAHGPPPPSEEDDPTPPPPKLPQIPVHELQLTHEMDVAVLLRALADAADLNVLIGERVSGPVLISLRGETRWDRLFLGVVEAHGLHYELEEDLLRILSREDVERQIAMERALHERLQAAEQRSSAEPLQVGMFRVHYADAERLADSVRSTMEGMTTANPDTEANGGPRRRSPTMIMADADSGLLIVHAIPSDVERARSLIRVLDQPAYQILIEASIVQASSDTARELGVQWGAFHTARDGRLGIGTTPRADGFNSNFPAPFDPAGPGFTLGIQRINQREILEAQLSALQRDGLLNIVSSPSITTLDKQTAVIESGEERPFQSAVGTGIAAVPQIEFKRAVLRLEVTPQVIDENWVKLMIDTTKDEFDDSQAVIIDGSLQVPIITRTALTTLYLADGQTTVIGGLSSETRSKTEAGIPILKDLPLLGGLFRNRTNRTALSDTLIFITPRILPQGNRDLPPGEEVEPQGAGTNSNDYEFEPQGNGLLPSPGEPFPRLEEVAPQPEELE